MRENIKHKTMQLKKSQNLGKKTIKKHLIMQNVSLNF